jgi:hypothetical protein
MDDAVARVAKKNVTAGADLERTERLKERLEGLLLEAATVEVELSRADGSIKGVPHYSVIERRAHELGKQLSQAVQRQQMRELAAAQPTTGKCPACGTRCELTTKKRDLTSIDGPAEVPEMHGYCPGCRRAFFPSA